MSEYIEFDALYKAYEGTIVVSNRADAEEVAKVLETIRKRVRDIPKIEIVRCKECKYWRAYENYSQCEMWTADPYESAPTEEDDFCSFGERNEVYTGEIELTEASSQELLRILQEQDSKFINKVFDGECGFTLRSSDGRSVQLTPKEIVLCKDCKYSYTGNYFRGYACRLAGDNDAGLPNDINEADGYCHRGERRK